MSAEILLAAPSDAWENSISHSNATKDAMKEKKQETEIGTVEPDRQWMRKGRRG